MSNENKNKKETDRVPRKDNRTEGGWVLRKPFDEDTLRTVMALAESGSKDKAHAQYACERILKEIAFQWHDQLQDGDVRTEQEVQAIVTAIWKKDDDFHALPTVAQIVEALVRAEPTFPAYAAMNAKPGNKLKKSGTKVYKKGTSFMSHTRERLGTLAKTDRSWTELTMWLNDNVKTYQKSVVEQLLSPKFVCAGTLMSPDRPCPHGCTVMDNTDGKRDLKDFQLDHAIGFNYLPEIWKSITAEIHKSYKPGKREGARIIARSFMRHLVFGTTKQSIYNWPPAVYARCGRCNLEGNTDAGGSTHPRVWEPVPEPTDAKNEEIMQPAAAEATEFAMDSKSIDEKKKAEIVRDVLMLYPRKLGKISARNCVLEDPAGGSPKDPVAVKQVRVPKDELRFIPQEEYDAIIKPHVTPPAASGATPSPSSE